MSVLRCPKHDLDALLRTSYTIGNRGRQFWICPLRPEKGSPDEGTDRDCRFFSWQDELETPPPLTPTTPTMASPTKRTSPFKSDPARQKRIKNAIEGALSSATTPSTTHSTSRKARLEAQIREALATPELPPPPPDQGVNITPTHPTHAPPIDTSSGRLSYKLADLGLDLSGHRPTVIRPRFFNQQPPPSPPSGDPDDDELWNAVGGGIHSPSSSQDEQERVAVDLVHPSPSPDQVPLSAKSKGKQRADETEEEAFWMKPQNPTSPLGLFSPGMSTSRSGPSQQQPMNHEDQLTGESIRTLLDNLRDIPEYVINLEKRLAVMQRLDEDKSKKIAELEKEIDTLKSNQNRLPTPRRR